MIAFDSEFAYPARLPSSKIRSVPCQPPESAIRPHVVEQARRLLQDPGFPGPEVIRETARILLRHPGWAAPPDTA